MIEKMEKIFIYGLSEDASRLVRDIMRCGCLQVSDPRQLEDYGELSAFVDKRSSGLYDGEQMLSKLTSALSALAPYIVGKGFLAQKPVITMKQLEDSDTTKEAMEVCDRVEALQKERNELCSGLGRATFTKDSLTPWQNYMVPLGETATKSCRIQLFTVPVSTDLTELDKELAASGLAVGTQLVSSDKDQHYIATIALGSDAAAAEELLRLRGASRVNFADLTGTPGQEMGKTTAQIGKLETAIAETEVSLKKMGEQGDLLKQVFDGLQTTLNCLRAEQKLLHTQKTCLLAAWLPVSKRPRVEKLLATYTCYYELVTPEKNEDTPVLLKNNKFIAPFESVTEMYSIPASGGIDPDPFMAPFFFLFFGMMLSDAGYGLLLTIGGLIGAKLMGGSKLMKMLGYCGISTIFWGLIYGSFFGDAITKVAATFFDVQFTMPVLIDPLKQPMTILVMAFVFGAIHIFVGMGLSAYLMIRRGHPWAALFDVGSWYLVLIGLVMLVAGGLIGQIGMYMAIIGAVTLILTQGRDKKNIFMKAASGLLSLYNITGYFSDVLSYSRIMALGLATGVIASVVNTMGTMPGKNILGVIAFIVIFLFGHLLNFAINALGSYVHTSRLQYVEFFGKFFEGGGKGFIPLRANTKYVNINNQEDN